VAILYPIDKSYIELVPLRLSRKQEVLKDTPESSTRFATAYRKLDLVKVWSQPNGVLAYANVY